MNTLQQTLKQNLLLSQPLYNPKLFFQSNLSTASEQQTLTNILSLVEVRTKTVPKRLATNTNKWSSEQTNMLFKLMGVYSTDFQIISQFLGTKNRAQVKRKFKLLQRTHGKELNEILNGQYTEMDSEILARVQEIMAQ